MKCIQGDYIERGVVHYAAKYVVLEIGTNGQILNEWSDSGFGEDV
jgi:hypothetical protein